MAQRSKKISDKKRNAKNAKLPEPCEYCGGTGEIMGQTCAGHVGCQGTGDKIYRRGQKPIYNRKFARRSKKAIRMSKHRKLLMEMKHAQEKRERTGESEIKIKNQDTSIQRKKTGGFFSRLFGRKR